jgi:MarR family transcriptional regulator, temperature-dependent positive regulator of motility
MSPSSPDPMPTSVLFDVFALGQAVKQLLLTTMADGPLRPEEYAIYSAIFELESLTPTQLAARLGMPLTTAVDHVRALEARGHARRVPNPRDGRSYLVVLTSDGLAAHRDANRRFELAYRAFAEALPGGEQLAAEHLADLRAAAERATLALTEGAVRPARGSAR